MVYFVCSSCPLSFTSRRIYTKHAESCSRNVESAQYSSQSFVCSLCNQSFAIKFDFVHHLVNHLSEIEVSFQQKSWARELIFAQVASITRTTLPRQRSKNQRRKKSVYCSICQIKFDSPQLLILHCKLSHSEHTDLSISSLQFIVTVFDCDLCGTKFGSLDDLEIHCCGSSLTINDTNTELVQQYLPKEFIPLLIQLPTSLILLKRYLCSICKMLVLSPRVANFHLLRHNSNHLVSGATNVCPRCFEVFPHASDLASHLFTHSIRSTGSNVARRIVRNGRSGDFVCELCGNWFCRYVYYENHIIRHRQRKLHCPGCEKCFLNRQHLKYHKDKCEQLKMIDDKGQLSRSQSIKSGVTCVYCSQVFSGAKTLGLHVKKMHKCYIMRKNLRCPEENCGLLYKSYSNVARHYRLHHLAKDHCPVCKKSVQHLSEDQAKLHVIRHRLPLLTCALCMRHFYCSSNLRLHRREKHSLLHMCANKYRLNYASFVENRRRTKDTREGLNNQAQDHGTKCGLKMESKAELSHHLVEKHSITASQIRHLRLASAVDPTPLQQFSDVSHQLAYINSFKTEVTTSSVLSSTCASRGGQEQGDPPVSDVIMADQDLKTPSSADGLNFYGTLQLGEYELPLYQMSADQLKQLHIDHAFSFQGTSATISRSTDNNPEQQSPT